MVPQEELDRALARWRSRIHGHEAPPVVVQIPAATMVTATAPATQEEATQIVTSPYQGGESGVVAEVNLDDGDFEDYNSQKSAP
jgi:hypothetical protein